MKYIKLFESFISKEELVQDANDICLELNDNNIRTECYYNNPYVLDGKSQPGFITVGMEKMYGDEEWSYDADILEWHEVEEVVDRLIEYFESNGWKLSVIMTDGDNLINPKEWVETLRKKAPNGKNYVFSGLTINFIEN